MTLLPTLTETISRARADLRMGLPVVIDGHLAAAVETLSPARLGALRTLGAPVLDSFALYEAAERSSLDQIARSFGTEPVSPQEG